MSAITSLRTLGLVAAAATALFVMGCSTTTTTSTTATRSATPASSATPSAPHLTTADLAWIQSVTKLRQQIDKPFTANRITMTRAKMRELRNALRSCQRELNRIGAPSALLQPAYALVQQACRTYTKGARCFAKAVRVSDVSGGVIAGTSEERIQRRSLACGFAGYGNGSNLMSEAEAEAAGIRAQYP